MQFPRSLGLKSGSPTQHWLKSQRAYRYNTELSLLWQAVLIFQRGIQQHKPHIPGSLDPGPVSEQLSGPWVTNLVCLGWVSSRHWWNQFPWGLQDWGWLAVLICSPVALNLYCKIPALGLQVYSYLLSTSGYQICACRIGNQSSLFYFCFLNLQMIDYSRITGFLRRIRVLIPLDIYRLIPVWDLLNQLTNC